MLAEALEQRITEGENPVSENSMALWRTVNS
jgi:hypothetical protein